MKSPAEELLDELAERYPGRTIHVEETASLHRGKENYTRWMAAIFALEGVPTYGRNIVACEFAPTIPELRKAIEEAMGDNDG